MDPETCRNQLAHQNTSLGAQGVPYFNRFLGPLDGESLKKIRKKSKNPLFSQFPWLDIGISWPEKCSKRPNMALPVPPVRYFDGRVGFYRFLGTLDGKSLKKLRKKSKNPFFRPHFRTSRSLPSAKIWSRSSILVLFGPLVGHWDMQSCFPMFVWVFQAIRGVKIDLDQNMAFLGWNP